MKGRALPPSDFKEDLWELLRRTERPILLYGMGNGADKMIARLETMGKQCSDVFASDGFVRGQSFHGKRVISFSEVKENYKDPLILVCFGSSLPDVLDTVFKIANSYELYIPDMPIAGEVYFTAAFYTEHYERFARVYEMLADEASRALYTSLLWYKLTGAPLYLKDAVATGDERALLSYDRMTSAVDVGAYRGDTLEEMLLNAPHLETVFALEPDGKNFKKLSHYAEGIMGKELFLFNAAAWENEGELSFASSGNRNATLREREKAIAGTASYEYRATTVKTVKIDDIIQGRKVDYIKYDTEGAELSALVGSEGTIRGSSPAMRISAYHRSEDLFALPLWLYEKMGDRYAYYLRRRLSIPAWDIELIAVPKQKQ